MNQGTVRRGATTIGATVPWLLFLCVAAVPLVFVPPRTGELLALVQPKVWLAYLLVAAIAGASLCRLAVERPVHPGRLALGALVALVLWASLALALSPEPAAGVPVLRALGVFAIAYLCAAAYPGSARAVLAGLVVGGGLCAALFGLQEYGTSVPGLPRLQQVVWPAGTFPMRNNPVYLIAAALTVVVWMLVRERRGGRFAVLTLSATLLLFALLVGRSRGGWIAGLLGPGLVCALELRRWRPVGRRHLAVLVGCAALLLVTLLTRPGDVESATAMSDRPAPPPTPGESLTERLDLVHNNYGFLHRLAIWEVAGELLVERPLFGVGPGVFPRAAHPRLPDGYDSVPVNANNEVVNIAVDFGIPAALLLCLLLGAVLLRGVRLWRRDPERWPSATLAVVVVLAWMSVWEVIVANPGVNVIAAFVVGAVTAGAVTPPSTERVHRGARLALVLAVIAAAGLALYLGPYTRFSGG
jgi:O-antigen ligase